MPERSEGVERVRLARSKVWLGADRLCGPRWVRYAVSVPEHVVVYRVESGWGETVACTADEAGAWEAAARTYLGEVSRALEELYRAHGGRAVRVDLAADRRTWTNLWYPISWPGWQRRWAQRSKRAQYAFVDRVQRARQAYETVSAEAARRYEVVHGARKAEERRRAEEEELRRQERVRRNATCRQVADGCSWIYIRRGGNFHVYRVDIGPAPPPGAHDPSPSAPMSTSSLESVVRGEILRSRHGSHIRWNSAASAAVERECAALGQRVTFAEWWDTVAEHHWTTDKNSGRDWRSRVVYNARSDGHRAFGWYGGDFGTAGHDAGGHSGGFGTSF